MASKMNFTDLEAGNKPAADVRDKLVPEKVTDKKRILMVVFVVFVCLLVGAILLCGAADAQTATSSGSGTDTQDVLPGDSPVSNEPVSDNPVSDDAGAPALKLIDLLGCSLELQPADEESTENVKIEGKRYVKIEEKQVRVGFHYFAASMCWNMEEVERPVTWRSRILSFLRFSSLASQERVASQKRVDVGRVIYFSTATLKRYQARKEDITKTDITMTDLLWRYYQSDWQRVC